MRTTSSGCVATEARAPDSAPEKAAARGSTTEADAAAVVVLAVDAVLVSARMVLVFLNVSAPAREYGLIRA